MSICWKLRSDFPLKHLEELVDSFPYRMLKSAVRVHRSWRVKREIYEKGVIRSSGFKVPKTSNLELSLVSPVPFVSRDYSAG